ncbi:MAG: metallophosphoesterase [Clostridiales bacterium]|nr:metallophosphoesterase [Clostridiales bacterium]
MQRFTLARYELHTEKLHAPVRILIIADLHSTRYGEKQETLLSAAEAEKPDIVLFPGDIVDDKRPEAPAMVLFSALTKKLPCYYVPGNHEFRTGKLPALKEQISAAGVTVLDGAAAVLSLPGGRVFLTGVDDPAQWGGYRTFGAYAMPKEWEAQLEACKKAACAAKDAFCILLSHRPEPVKYYTDSKFDLVAAGHAHGGQLRFGPINGVFAPCQGLFPRYAGGLYTLGKTRLLVSRGLMRNKLPRFGNPPELVSLTLLPVP